MSIEKQTCHCFQGLLGAIDIKVLQTLGMVRETRSVVTVARGPVPRDLST